MAEKLTDRTAKTSSFANDDVIHVVDVSDTSQDPAGSSFKSALGDIYGSYLAPKITSSQIVTDAPDTYSVTLADTTSSNHFLFINTDSGDPFVDVIITSYASPKDGAIVVVRLNKAGTDDLNILGCIFSAAGFESGIHTCRYSSSSASWISVGFQAIDGTLNLQEVTDYGNTTTNDIEFGTGKGILLNNGSILREGTTDAGTGGNNGIAQICAVGYELKWEAGSQYVMDGNGLLVREVNHKFNTAPGVGNDDSEGFYVGSRWILDDGTIYTCTDDSTGAAVWKVYPYAVYTALLSATAGVTSVIVLENTIGNIVWVQDPIFGSGKYRGTLAGAFSTSSKFFALTGFKSQTSEYSSIQHMDVDSCLFEINVIATGINVDTFTNYIELRIYP
jgi:hypothetical protein